MVVDIILELQQAGQIDCVASQAVIAPVSQGWSSRKWR